MDEQKIEAGSAVVFINEDHDWHGRVGKVVQLQPNKHAIVRLVPVGKEKEPRDIVAPLSWLVADDAKKSKRKATEPDPEA